MIYEGHQITKALNLTTHTLVIGSGAGGGVVSYNLAKAGVKTIVLEEGGRFQAKDMTQREEQMYPQLYRAGAQQLTSDGQINVAQGSAFGGSTLINAADVTPIEPEVLKHWQKHHSISEITEATLAPSYKRVRQQIGAAKIQPNLINNNNDLIIDAAKKQGLKADTFDSNRKNCIGSGYCMQGCAYDAKRGTNLSYLPQASELGADIYTDVRVDRIEKLKNGQYKIHATVIERGLRTAIYPVEVIAKRVILSAGAVHSPAILKRSGLDKGLPQLGKNLSLQPQMVVGAQFDESRKMNSQRGIPQATYLSEYDDHNAEHGLGGYRIEGVGGVLSNMVGNFPGIGDQHKQLLKAYTHTHYSLLLIPDQPSGEINWQWKDDGTVVPKIDYVLTEEWKARARDAVKNIGQFFFNAGAKRVYFSNNNFPVLESAADLDKAQSFPIYPGVTTFISAHVQGTCRMGTNAQNSVVDQNLKLHTEDNIYVIDASIMPTSASTHTMLPIMAMADYAVHKMLASDES